MKEKERILYKNSMYSCCTHAMLYLLFFLKILSYLTQPVRVSLLPPSMPSKTISRTLGTGLDLLAPRKLEDEGICSCRFLSGC